MVEGAIKGFVEGLGDPYTEYLPKEEMTEFTEETSSQYVGIGVYLTMIRQRIPYLLLVL